MGLFMINNSNKNNDWFRIFNPFISKVIYDY